MKKIKFCFTSEKARELYNGKPPQYETPFASGFDLRVRSYSHWYEPGMQFVNVENEKLLQGCSMFEVTKPPSWNRFYDDKFIIKLVSKYKTKYAGDWSNGEFLHGSIVVNTEAEASQIIDRFLYEGKITLYEVDKSNNISKELSTVSFASEKYFGGEVYKGKWGFGMIKKAINDDQYVYFLDITKPKQSIVLNSNGRILIKTGIRIELPLPNKDGEILGIDIRSRSGLASKHGLRVFQGVGTVDNDYRGELCVIFENAGHVPYEIKLGDKIAQGVFNPLKQVDFQEISQEEFEATCCDTKRGSGGFGSTGK